MARRPSAAVGGGGLEALRRSGAVSELLFLYECWTRTIVKLRDVADRLGLTVQAVSHLYRELARRGWVEVRHRRYTLTVAGVNVLHGALSALGEDIGQRLERLQIVRTTLALARRPTARGQAVSLELVDGLLTASPGGRAASRGTARSAARAGELVEVGGLEGIVPITSGAISVYVVPRGSASRAAVLRRASAAVRSADPGLVVAQGLEAVHVARRATPLPVTRFGASGACRDASSLGVRSVAFVTEEELPRFLAPFAGPSPPPITVARLG